MRAVYKDEKGGPFSCPVEIHDGDWAIVTSDGHKPIAFYFDDDVAGRLKFLRLRLAPL